MIAPIGKQICIYFFPRHESNKVLGKEQKQQNFIKGETKTLETKLNKGTQDCLMRPAQLLYTYKNC